MFEFIVRLISQGGYLGILSLMALENIFPPIPSELIMPLAGFIAARGELNLIAVLIAGTIGSVIGTLPWYYAGRVYGKDRLINFAGRHGRWLTVSPHDIEKSLDFFHRHGRMTVFFGRLIPAVRTLISAPAGIAGMPLMQFLFYSTMGSLIWTGLLTAAGFLLQSQYELVGKYVEPVSKFIVVALFAFYLYRIVTYRPRP